jgi:hypothetical protein
MDWIDKNHLDRFAARKDARDLLPALIYDLILRIAGRHGAAVGCGAV